MTLVWFICWFISDHIGDRAALSGDPVNTWTTLLLLALAIDLSTHSARAGWRGRR